MVICMRQGYRGQCHGGDTLYLMVKIPPCVPREGSSFGRIAVQGRPLRVGDGFYRPDLPPGQAFMARKGHVKLPSK